MTSAKTNYSKVPFVDLIGLLLNSPFNTTTSIGKASKILKLVHKDGFKSVHEFLLKEETRLRSDFTTYYGYDILDITRVLVNWNKVDTLLDAIKNDNSFRGFHWVNYSVLESANLMYLLSEFDTDFRGDITHIHFVNREKYIIIETVKEGKGQFYTVKGKRLESMYCNSFDEAILFAVCPTYFNAMLALYNASKEKV